MNDVFSPSSVPLEKENKKLTESITDKSSKLYEAPGLFEEDDNFESNKSSCVIGKFLKHERVNSFSFIIIKRA